MQLRSSAWRFKGDDFAWLVVVGNAAILELDGLREGAPRRSGSGCSTRASRRRRHVPGLARAVSSGVVGAAQGNLQVRSK